MRNYISLAVIFGLAAFICNDIEDTLAHHYEQSVFFEGSNSFWNPAWERVKPIAEANPWLPRWTYDGWHLIKVFRQHFLFAAFFFVILIWNRAYVGEVKWMPVYVKWAAIYHVIVWLMHIAFYDYLFLA